MNINKCVTGECEINKEHENQIRLAESEKDADLSSNLVMVNQITSDRIWREQIVVKDYPVQGINRT